MAAISTICTVRGSVTVPGEDYKSGELQLCYYANDRYLIRVIMTGNWGASTYVVCQLRLLMFTLLLPAAH